MEVVSAFKKASFHVLILIVMATRCTAEPNVASPQTMCFTCTGETCQSVESYAPFPQFVGGVFERGDIDLTGDGLPEQVQLEAAQVRIMQKGIEVWRSPEVWHVVDLALGDPNNDGRSEILVVFWKQDETGQARNQPFIIGYRGGYYRELWGGSPVGFPIQEVELADVNDDGQQEIIVLEAMPEDTEASTVAIWRWQQWWFNFVWRSDAGPYHDLQIAHDEDKGSDVSPTFICVTIEK